MDQYKKNKQKSIICWVIAFALAIFYLIVSVMPFVFMVLNSFKEKFEMLAKGVFNLPDSLNPPSPGRSEPGTPPLFPGSSQSYFQ